MFCITEDNTFGQGNILPKNTDKKWQKSNNYFDQQFWQQSLCSDVTELPFFVNLQNQARFLKKGCIFHQCLLGFFCFFFIHCINTSFFKKPFLCTYCVTKLSIFAGNSITHCFLSKYWLRRPYQTLLHQLQIEQNNSMVGKRQKSNSNTFSAISCSWNLFLYCFLILVCYVHYQFHFLKFLL